MGAKVIQGSFLAGRPMPMASVQPKMIVAARHSLLTKAGAQTKITARAPGPPTPAFGGTPTPVQRHSAGGAFAVEAGPLGLAAGGGRPLTEAVRGKMEAALGADFSNVRVHVGPQAERIGAIAFTIGSDIYFAPGRYQPETLQGQQLLGHELTHVVQQRAGRVRNPIGSGLAVVQDHALEAEADRLGQRAATHSVEMHAKIAAKAPRSSVPAQMSQQISAGDRARRNAVVTPRPTMPPLPAQLPAHRAAQRAPADMAKYGGSGLALPPSIRIGVRFPRSGSGAIEVRFNKPSRPAAVAGTVQRKVGFEMEDAFWEPYIKWPLQALRPARRKEVLYAHSLFKLEGDDSGGPNNPSLEFVTKPFDISNAGLYEVERAFRRINQIINTIGQNQDANGNPADGDLNNPAAANFVKNNDHHLNSRLWLSKGRNRARFKLQATQGSSLEDLPLFMSYAGTNVPGETAIETGQRQGLRTAMYGAGLLGFNANIPRVIGSAPTLADNAINHLAANVGAPYNANTARLRGFFSLVILYVKMLSVPETNYVKYLIPLHARTNLAAQFAQLPAAQRTALAANNSQDLITGVLHGANSVPLIPNAVAGGHYDTNFMGNTPLVRSFTPGGGPALFQSLTIRDWLRGLTAGRDYLTPSKMRDWLRQNAPALSKTQRKQQAGYLESFGSLGRHTDNPLRAGHSRQVVFENRTIVGANAYFTVQEAYEFAYRYLQFLINTKNTGGQPGQYPVAAPPAL